MAVLNYDVLLLVMTFLPKTAVSRLMRSCRTLYEPGVRFVLRDVCLHTSQAVDSLSMFITAQSQYSPQRRYQFLLELEFLVETPTPENMDTLVYILGRATSLRSLLIQSPGLFEADKRTCTAIAALDALETLSLKVPIELKTLRTLLGSLKEGIKTVDVRHVYKYDRNTRLPEPIDKRQFSALVDASSLFEPISSSLEELRVALRIPITSSHIPAFPALHKLHLYGTSTLKRAALVSRFPNLRELSMEYNWESQIVYWPLEYGLYVARCHDHRTLNKASATSWPDLRRVRGLMRAVYALGLTTHLEELSLASAGQNDVAVLSAVLSDTCPAILRMEWEVTKPSDMDGLSTALGCADGHIKCLDIRLDHDEMEWVSVSSLLVSFPLHHSMV